MRLISVIAIFFILFLFIPSVVKNYTVYNSGKLVNAIIVEMPDNCLVKNKLVIISYNKRNHIKRISRIFCQKYNIGDTIEMHYNDGMPEVLEFTGTYHKYIMELVSCLLLIAFFIVLFFKSK